MSWLLTERLLEIGGGVVAWGVIVRLTYRCARGVEAVRDNLAYLLRRDADVAAELDSHAERLVVLEDIGRRTPAGRPPARLRDRV